MAEEVDIQTQPFYLKKAKLKGYKSIKDAEVDFCDGLNIIIGKNASGKSNLLEILFSTLELNTDNHFPTDAELTLHGLKDLKIKANYIPSNRLKLNPESRKVGEQTEFKFTYDDQTIEESEEKKIFLNVGFIKYNIPNPKNYPIIAYPLILKYYSKSHDIELDEKIANTEFPKSIIRLLYRFMYPYFTTMPLKQYSLEEMKKKLVKEVGERIKGLNRLFEDLMPVKELRFNPHINIHFEKESGIFTFSNLFIEFKINKSWLPYSSLSDGTKRLFYIISELYIRPNSGYPKGWFKFKDENIDRNIFFFEEPELGIHPHQLHQLMSFIKEQSEEKQIILSTHSPMVLDVLGKDDLHRIIIASNDDPKKGSQFRHLTEEEKEKARLYMDGDYLSDYWKYSDLEK